MTETPLARTSAASATSDRALTLALVCGLVHAGATLYWALGGTALLDTVGTWAVPLHERDQPRASVVLAVVGLVKLAAATVPALSDRGLVPWPELWRTLTWPGAALLVVYGGVNMIGAWLQLLGVWPISDPAGTVGHALLWDPLFAIWGASLLIWLRAEENPQVRGGAQVWRS